MKYNEPVYFYHITVRLSTILEQWKLDLATILENINAVLIVISSSIQL